MTVDNKVKELAVEVERLHRLLSDPQTGLMVWWSLFSEQAKTVAKLLREVGIK